VVEESLESLLRAATVRVEGGPRPGAGFFVAPGLVLTCVHVVGTADGLSVRSAASGPEREAVVEEVVWRLRDRGRPIPALAEDYPDLALLRVGLEGHMCVAVDGDWPSFGDEFQTYGFPDEGGARGLLTPALLSYRGTKGNEPEVFIDLASDTVRPGMSGGALLNLRTRGVCGIVVATRSPASPEGGLAVPWLALGGHLGAVLTANHEFHRVNRGWTLAVQSAVRRVRFRLPRVVQHFAGRTGELDALERALGAGGRAVITQAVTGLGGVGKTQLAARYVHAQLDAYDVIAWVRAEDGGVGDLAELAVALGLPLGEGLGSGDRAAAALRWLEGCEQRWLLVLDNVASPEQLAALSPGSGNGRVLATSRHRGLGQFGPALPVGVFDDDTGGGYLVARAGRPAERAAARRLTQALGGLPLALAHAGAYCSAGTTFEEYLGLLELPAAEMFDASPGVFYEQTVASTWQVSIEAAAAAAPLARPVLAMAAYLAPEKIPTVLFEVLIDDATDLRQRKRLIDGLHALHRFSLAEVQDGSLDVHRLLQKTVRDDAVAHDDPAGALAALEALTAAFPEDTSLPAWWPQCEQLLAHLLALADTLTATGESGPRLIPLLNRGCGYLLRTGGGERAVTVGVAAAELAERLLGPGHPHTLTARANLASSYRSAGRTGEAIAIDERLVADRERLLGPGHPDTLTARGNLASSYLSAGRTGEALAMFERVVADRERLLGPEHPDTLTARGNLASSYWSAGRTGEAIAIEERLVADRERLLGPEHPDTLTARGNLASSYLSAGRTGEAIAIEERVLADRERLLGPEHPGTLTARANLASSYRSAGRTGEAIAMFERVVADRERLLGPEHPGTLTARGNLAFSYWSAGRTGEALAIEERLLADRERLLGPEHPGTLTTRGNLAFSYRSAGRTGEAPAMFEQLVADRERLLGPEHPGTLTARGNLAFSYRSAGRTGEALAMFEQLLADSERLLGPEHPDTISASSALNDLTQPP